MDFTIYLARVFEGSFAPCIIHNTDFKYYSRGKAGKTAALTNSQPGVADYGQPLALPHQNIFLDYALYCVCEVFLTTQEGMFSIYLSRGLKDRICTLFFCHSHSHSHSHSALCNVYPVALDSTRR